MCIDWTMPYLRTAQSAGWAVLPHLEESVVIPLWIPFWHLYALCVNRTMGHPFHSVPLTSFKLVYSFPIAALPNYCKFSGLKQHKLIFLQFWKTLVRNQGWFLLEALKGESFSLSLSSLRGHSCIPGPVAPASVIQSFYPHITFFSSVVKFPPAKCHRTPVITFRSTGTR